MMAADNDEGKADEEKHYEEVISSIIPHTQGDRHVTTFKPVVTSTALDGCRTTVQEHGQTSGRIHNEDHQDPSIFIA